jgi:hypothetical protein
MKMRKLLAALLMAIIPAFGFAQGKGKGNGNPNKDAKAHKAAKANNGKTVKTEKAIKVKNKPGKMTKSQTVKVRNQRTNTYSGFKPKGGPPPWAPAHGYRAKQHAYFPDYHVFYDPYRGGYSYWQNNSWNFSPRVPAFLGGIDLGKARIQVLGDVPVTTRPEIYYNRYAELYPARSINISVPVPGR